MDQKLIKANINISGRSYPIKVNVAEQAKVKDIEKQLNSEINQVRQRYPNQEPVDHLSLCLIKLAFEQASTISNDDTLAKALKIRDMLHNVD